MWLKIYCRYLLMLVRKQNRWLGDCVLQHSREIQSQKEVQMLRRCFLGITPGPPHLCYSVPQLDGVVQITCSLLGWKETTEVHAQCYSILAGSIDDCFLSCLTCAADVQLVHVHCGRGAGSRSSSLQFQKTCTATERNSQCSVWLLPDALSPGENEKRRMNLHPLGFWEMFTKVSFAWSTTMMEPELSGCLETSENQTVQWFASRKSRISQTDI